MGGEGASYFEPGIPAGEEGNFPGSDNTRYYELHDYDDADIELDIDPELQKLLEEKSVDVTNSEAPDIPEDILERTFK